VFRNKLRQHWLYSDRGDFLTGLILMKQRFEIVSALGVDVGDDNFSVQAPT